METIPEVSKAEVSRALGQAPASSSNGPDDIPAAVLREVMKTKQGTLEKIYTEVLRSGKHPREWKTVVIYAPL